MSIKLKKINNINIKPYKVVPDLSMDKIQGGELFGLGRNIFICAKKNSGKTSIICNILEKCTNKLSTVFIICSTVELDKTYKMLQEKLNKKGVMVVTFQSINDIDENGLKVNNLELIMDYMDKENMHHEEGEEEEEEEEKPRQLIIKPIEDSPEKKKRKPRPPKKMANKYFIVLDDLSNELRDIALESFVKKNRHFNACAIVSNQAFIDLSPATRKQFDDVLLLGGHQKDKLSIIYKDIDPPISLDLFLKLYKDATKEKYNFLNCSREGIFKKNFNKEYKLE